MKKSKKFLMLALSTLANVLILNGCSLNGMTLSCSKIDWNKIKIGPISCSRLKIDEPLGEAYSTNKILSVANATVDGGKNFSSEKMDPAVSYTGLSVSSKTPYDGTFNATFTSDVALTYKFTGVASQSSNPNALKTDANGEEYSICDGNGDFYFTITSSVDLEKTFTYRIVPTENGSGDATAYVYCNGIYAVADMAKVQYKDNLNDALQYQNQSQNLGFNSNETSYANGFKFIKENGIWKFYVQDSLYNLGGERTYELAVFDGAHRLPNWDFSEGYTISFGSENGVGIDSDDDGEADDFGTDVCFLSINETNLNSATSHLSTDTKKQEIKYPEELPLTDKNLISLKLGDSLGNFTFSQIGKSKIGGVEFNVDLGGEEFAYEELIDSSKIGIQTITVEKNGQTKEYEVEITPCIKELVDYDGLTLETANSEILTHTSKYAKGGGYYRPEVDYTTTFPRVSYKGLTLTSDGPYAGAFDTVFEGNTTLYYKFPGTAEDPTAIPIEAFKMYKDSAHKQFAFGIGDAAGDFYFKITSIADPTHTFTYKISEVPGRNYTRQYVELLNDSGQKIYSTFNKSSNVISVGTVGTSATPYPDNLSFFSYFNSNEKANQIYLKMYQTNEGYWALNTYYPRGRSGEWYNNTRDFAIFNGNGLMPAWDFSEGYTIEFGSNYATGTDICFTAINSDKLNRIDYVTQIEQKTISHTNEYVENEKNKITLSVGEKLEFSVVGVGKTYEKLGRTRTEYITGSKTITSETGGSYFDVRLEMEKFEYTQLDTSQPGNYEITVTKGGVSKMYEVEIVEQSATTMSMKTRNSLQTTSNNSYEITFLDWDGSVYFTATYYEGDTIDESFAMPQKPADNTYKYEFAGWSPEVETVTQDATYTPIFTSVYINYEVKFLNDDGKFISAYNKYHYGDEVRVPTQTPTKAEDDEYVYTFSGWDKEITTVTGDTVYTATYTKTAKQTQQEQSMPEKILTAIGCNSSLGTGGLSTAVILALVVTLFLKKKRVN